MIRFAPLLLLSLAAAAPQTSSAPAYVSALALSQGGALASRPPPPEYEPAPVPDLNAAAPARKAGPAKPQFGPTVFAPSRTQFRGDGFSPHSTAQIEQEKNFKPGGGFSLRMPLQ